MAALFIFIAKRVAEKEDQTNRDLMSQGTYILSRRGNNFSLSFAEGRGKVEGNALGFDREPGFATERKQMIPRRRSAFPSPLNGERIPRTISRIEPLNRVKSSASLLPMPG